MVRYCLGVLVAFAILPWGTVRAEDTKKDSDPNKHHLQATVAAVDSQKNSVTVKTVDKNGKEADKTFQLSKDAKLLNADGKDATLASFKPGDDVCITQKDDKVTVLKKHAEAKITKMDPKAGTITVKMKDKNGKSVEKTFRLVEDTEYIDSTGRVAVLDIFQSGDDVLFVEADGKIQAMKKADKDANTASKDSKGKSGNK